MPKIIRHYSLKRTQRNKKVIFEQDPPPSTPSPETSANLVRLAAIVGAVIGWITLVSTTTESSYAMRERADTALDLAHTAAPGISITTLNSYHTCTIIFILLYRFLILVSIPVFSILYYHVDSKKARKTDTKLMCHNHRSIRLFLLSKLIVTLLVISFLATRRSRSNTSGSSSIPQSKKRKNRSKNKIPLPPPNETRQTQIRGIIFGLSISLILSVAFLMLSEFSTYKIERGAKTPFCHADSCFDKNPYGTNCNSDRQVVKSYTVTENGSPRGKLTLMQSPKCHSNWVKWEGSDKTNNDLQIYQNFSGGTKAGIAAQFRHGHSGQNTWSNMISDKGDTCVQITLNYQKQSEHTFEPYCTTGLG